MSRQFHSCIVPKEAVVLVTYTTSCPPSYDKYHSNYFILSTLSLFLSILGVCVQC